MPNRFTRRRLGMETVVRALGAPMSAVLPVAAATMLAAVLLRPEGASFGGAILLGLTAGCLQGLLRRFGLSPAASPWAAFLICVGSALFPAAFWSPRRLVEVLAVLVAFLASLRWIEERSGSALVVTASCLTLAALSAGVWALALPLWGRWLAAEGGAPASRRAPLLLLLLLCSVVLLFLVVPFGDAPVPRAFAFSPNGLELVGLRAWAILFSLDRGILVHSPLLLLVALGWPGPAGPDGPLKVFLLSLVLLVWGWFAFLPFEALPVQGGLPPALPLVGLLAPLMLRGVGRLVALRAGRGLLVAGVVTSLVVQVSLVVFLPPPAPGEGGKILPVEEGDARLLAREGTAPLVGALVALGEAVSRGGEPELRCAAARVWREGGDVRRGVLLGGGGGALVAILLLLRAGGRRRGGGAESGEMLSRPRPRRRRRFGPWRPVVRPREGEPTRFPRCSRP